MGEKLIHQSEIFKLGLGLDERGINYDLYSFSHGLQIRVDSQGWGAVCHDFSYGHHSGSLEVMGWSILGHDDVSVMDAEEVLAKVDEILAKKK